MWLIKVFDSHTCTGSTSAGPKSSTLPHQRTAVPNQRDRERDGYYSGKLSKFSSLDPTQRAESLKRAYNIHAAPKTLLLFSDRNELVRERERERDRGYLSDHNSRYFREKKRIV